MKKWLTALIICVYAAPLSWLVLDELTTGYISSFAILVYLAAVGIAIKNIYNASREFSRSVTLSFRQALVFKLILIPFFVFTFLFYAWGFLRFPISALFMFIFIVMPYEYLIMIAVSAYIIERLKFLRKNSAIGKTTYALHTFAQFVFVLDVISIIILAITERKIMRNPGNTI
jgi:hypothetical protein